jgi:hypothetical protein
LTYPCWLGPAPKFFRLLTAFGPIRKDWRLIPGSDPLYSRCTKSKGCIRIRSVELAAAKAEKEPEARAATSYGPSIKTFPDSWADMTSRLINLFEIVLSLALLYGINLYFSANENINNPVVPVAWPVTKDAFLVLVFGLFFFRLHGHLRRLSLPLILVVAFSVTCAALSILFFGYSRESLSFSKNILLYFAGGAVIGTLIAGACSPSEIGLRMSRAVLLSVLVGFACLLLPVQSTDGRLYGTYGNPSSFGFAVFLAFALSAAFRPPLESIFFAVLLGLMFVVTGSMSILLAAGAFIVIFSVLEIFSKREIKLQVVHLVVIILSTALIGKLLSCSKGPDLGYERLVEIANAVFNSDVFTSDSVTIRLKAFVLPVEGTYQRYDSFFLGLYKNFGWAPLLVYFVLIVSLVAEYARSAQTKQQNAVAACIFCIFIINPLLQHQLEIFPTNLLFGLFLGCAICWLGLDQKEQVAYTVANESPTPSNGPA